MPSERGVGRWALASYPRSWTKGMAKKKGEVRVIIHLACTQCKERTYTTTKNKKNDPGRLELRKFCPRCHTHTLHRETR